MSPRGPGGWRLGRTQLSECAQVWDQSSFLCRTGHCSQRPFLQPGATQAGGGICLSCGDLRVVGCLKCSFDPDRLGFKTQH